MTLPYVPYIQFDIDLTITVDELRVRDAERVKRRLENALHHAAIEALGKYYDDVVDYDLIVDFTEK